MEHELENLRNEININIKISINDILLKHTKLEELTKIKAIQSLEDKMKKVRRTI